jgi:hypothetical protein
MSKSPRKSVLCSSYAHVGIIRTILYGLPIFTVDLNLRSSNSLKWRYQVDRKRCVNFITGRPANGILNNYV